MRKKIKKNSALEKVFTALRNGYSLYAACVQAEMSTKDFYALLADDAEARVSYQLALSDYADQCTDEIKAIAAKLKAGGIDNSTAKLLIETSKWLAQKACPEPLSEKGVLLAADEEGEEGGSAGGAEIVVKFI